MYRTSRPLKAVYRELLHIGPKGPIGPNRPWGPLGALGAPKSAEYGPLGGLAPPLPWGPYFPFPGRGPRRPRGILLPIECLAHTSPNCYPALRED